MSRGAPDASPASARLAVLALVFNALTWGLSWWPMRWLDARGLHPLWATALVYAAATVVICALRPAAAAHLVRTPRLAWLMVAAGTTNAAFNWGVTIGDVVRVVLLFYLMPAWSVLLARALLGERLTAVGALRIALALAGALVVLWPADGSGIALPATLAEWLGVLGGFSFALNNVLLRREAAEPGSARALAMFSGGALVAGAAALALGPAGGVPAMPPPGPWLLGAAGLAAAFLTSNLALQYGAARLAASATAAVMVSEVFFASASAALLGAGVVTPTLVAGGILIVLAAALAVR